MAASEGLLDALVLRDRAHAAVVERDDEELTLSTHRRALSERCHALLVAVKAEGREPV